VFLPFHGRVSLDGIAQKVFTLFYFLIIINLRAQF